MDSLFEEQHLFLRLALPVPLRRYFDYLPPRELSEAAVKALQPGVRVKVPFGKQNLTGLLVAVTSESEVPLQKLKLADAVLDSAPVLPDRLLSLVTWAAQYYQYPDGDALLSALPVLLREGQQAVGQSEIWWRLSGLGKGLPEGALKRSPKQQQVLALLQGAEQSAAELKQRGFSAAVLRELKKKELIEQFDKELSPDIYNDKPLLAQSAHTLSEEQVHAVNEVRSMQSFAPFLLEGVTGSGKTEVYLQVIEKVLQENKQALVLVPEIGLTPQTIERFQKRFNRPVVALHSGLNNKERLQAWLSASRDEAAIVIGTRSAIFTPMPNLGVIIVDEEHDQSFKQQDNFRYHARDLAIVRGQREDIPVVLGSATPSLETLLNAVQERYAHLRLTQRAGNASPPVVRLVDTTAGNLHEGLSQELIEAINAELEKNNQVLVFLNRRGYAPILICRDCSWMAECPMCNVRSTVHKTRHQLRCHHCGFQEKIPSHCPSCKSTQLEYLGQGTQRSEDALQSLFPNRKILRIDRDSIQRKKSLDDILEIVHRGDPAILVGTQMLAKGHHFPNVTLVAILDADGGIFSADFRGAEKFGQLITQVAGRAGRAEKEGKVLIQSQLCEHPVMQTLVTESYQRLARQLLAERQALSLPPYRQQAVLRSEALNLQEGYDFLQRVREIAEPLVESANRANNVVQMIGPVPALMEKRASYYRCELIFYTAKRVVLQQLLAQLAIQIESLSTGKKTRWAIDVDPV